MCEDYLGQEDLLLIWKKHAKKQQQKRNCVWRLLGTESSTFEIKLCAKITWDKRIPYWDKTLCEDYLGQKDPGPACPK